MQHRGNFLTPGISTDQLTMTTDVDDYTTGSDLGPYFMKSPPQHLNGRNDIDNTAQDGGNAGWYSNVTGGIATFTADTDDHTGY